jgi:hypothetical protein
MDINWEYLVDALQQEITILFCGLVDRDRKTGTCINDSAIVRCEQKFQLSEPTNNAIRATPYFVASRLVAADSRISAPCPHILKRLLVDIHLFRRAETVL